MMHNSVGKIVLRRWLSPLLLLISAPLAVGQQPAPQASPTAQTPAACDVRAHVTQTPIDASIKDDPAVDKMLAVYGPKVRALDVVIGKLKGELRNRGAGAGSLGNFVADGMRWQAGIKLGKPVDLAIINGSGLRRDVIGEGDLQARDIFELLPFENALVTLDLTGEQVLKLLGIAVSSREAQSGARVTYVVKADKSFQLEAAKLVDLDRREKEIDPKAIYVVVTIDYLINRGGDRFAVLREGKNTRPLGRLLRDAVMDYVKSETAAGHDIKPNLDGRFVLDRANSVLTGEAPPNEGQNRLR